MVGSDVDGDQLRGSVRGRSSTKRHQMCASSSSALVVNDGERDANVVARWKKVRGAKWRSCQYEVDGEAIGGGGRGGLEGDEGEPFQSLLTPTTTTSPSLASRKRVRLNGRKKAVKDCDAVDPAPVPRKLRSAINKRSLQSASSPLPDADGKKKLHSITNEINVSCPINGMRLDQNLSFLSITEDEKEVVEALFVLSREVYLSPAADMREEKRNPEYISTANAPSATVTKVSNDGDISLCYASAADKDLPSFIEKPVKETVNGESVVLEKFVRNSACQAVEPYLNGTPEPDCSKAARSTKIVQPNGTSLANAIKASISLGVSPHHYSENGLLQPAKYDVVTSFPEYKPHSKLWPSGSPEAAAALQNEVQPVEQNSKGNTKFVRQEEYAPVMQAGLPTSANGQIKMSSSSASAVWPSLPTSSPKPGLNCTTRQTKKLSPIPLTAMHSWKTSAIHICISHLIRDYKEKGLENQHPISVPSNTLKSKEKCEIGAVAASETPKVTNCMSSMASTAAKSSMVDRNLYEARNEALCNGIYLHAQQSSILPETYAQQKQTFDFQLLSTRSEASGYGSLETRRIHSSFLYPHHSTVPFPFSNVPHAAQNAEKPAASAKQQVNLQAPLYLGNPFYVQQTGSTASATKLQQQYQMWQAHIARCGSSLGVRVSQNAQLHDPSSIPRMSAQPLSPISSTVQSATYSTSNAQQQQQLLSNPSSPPSMGKHHQRHYHQSGGHHNGVALLHEGSSQLQLLCNAQR